MTRYSPEYRRFYNDEYYFKDKEYKPSKRAKYVVRKNVNPIAYLARRVKMAKYMSSKYAEICPSGWTRGQGWGGLYKAWQAFILYNQANDIDSMQQYAQIIRKIQKDMQLQLHEFPNLKLAALEYARDPDNHDLLEEKADDLGKEVDDLNSQDVLNVMLQQDRLAYELAGMQY
jgi:hypothetical protein